MARGWEGKDLLSVNTVTTARIQQKNKKKTRWDSFIFGILLKYTVNWVAAAYHLE